MFNKKTNKKMHLEDEEDPDYLDACRQEVKQPIFYPLDPDLKENYAVK